MSYQKELEIHYSYVEEEEEEQEEVDTMNKYYDKKFLEDTLILIKDNLADLSRWSVHNDDKWLDEIALLEKTFYLVADILKGGEKK